MPEVRPGQVHYTAATKVVNHGDPCVEDGFAGVAIKQQAAPAGTGYGAAAITQIGIGENFIIQFKGRVYITNPTATFHKGDPVYIKTSDNSLQTAAGAGIVKFGRCTEVAGTRGVGVGKMRVDLDARDSF